MPYPDSVDALTDVPFGADAASADPNAAYAALRDLRTKLGPLASVPDDLLDSAPDNSLIVKRNGVWESIDSGTYRKASDPIPLTLGLLQPQRNVSTDQSQPFGQPGFVFPHDGNEPVLACVVPVQWMPWSSAHLDILWFNLSGTESGDVEWETRRDFADVGETMGGALSSHETTVVTAGAQYEIMETRVRTSMATAAMSSDNIALTIFRRHPTSQLSAGVKIIGGYWREA